LVRCEEMMEGQWGAGQRTVTASPRAQEYVLFSHAHRNKLSETDKRQLQSSAGADCDVEGGSLKPEKAAFCCANGGRYRLSMGQSDKVTVTQVARRDGQRIQRVATIELLKGVTREW